MASAVAGDNCSVISKRRLASRTLERFESHARGQVVFNLGKGDWKGLQSVPLFEEEAVAVCAPSLIAKHARLRVLRSPQDLLVAPLIHVNPSRGLDWFAWLRALGTRVPDARTMRYPTINELIGFFADLNSTES